MYVRRLNKDKRSKKRELLRRQGHSESKAPGSSFLFGCAKIAYKTEEDAFRSVCTRMKYEYETFDWTSFKVYQCKYCHKFHLTKALNGKI